MNTTSPRVLFVHEYTLRPNHPNSGFERALLDYLHGQGWSGAPELFARDHEDRLIHACLRGTSIHDGRLLSDDYLVRTAELVREFHDLTAGTSLANGQEVVCHNNLAPRHTISQRDLPYAFVDWEHAAPGLRVQDIAHVCWKFVPMGPDAVDAPRRIRLICDTYGLIDRTRLVEAVLWWQDRSLRGIESAAQAGAAGNGDLRSRGTAQQVRAETAWVHEHRRELERAVTEGG